MISHDIQIQPDPLERCELIIFSSGFSSSGIKMFKDRAVATQESSCVLVTSIQLTSWRIMEVAGAGRLKFTAKTGDFNARLMRNLWI